SSAPLRGEQRVPRSAGRGRAGPLRTLTRWGSGRADRAAGGSSSLVHGEPVPSRAPLPADGLPSALPGLHPGGAPASARPSRGAAPWGAPGGGALVSSAAVRIGPVTIGGGGPPAPRAGACGP